MPDPYCYRGSTVLRNRLGLRDQVALDAYEAELVTQRLAEPLPAGRLSVSHYLAMHRHIFGDIYPWAGRLRRVRIAKGGSMFCYPEHIPAELRRVFSALRTRDYLIGLAVQPFAKGAAHFLAELNAIHPFRDGNGRTQLAFMATLAAAAGHPLDFQRLDPPAFLAAMIASFQGDEDGLASALQGLVE